MNYEEMPYDFASLNVRKSVFDMQVLTLDDEYPGELPEELKQFHYYFAREGHVLMVIPRNYLEKALEEEANPESDVTLDDYEIQIPVKYVLEKGYEFIPGHLNYIVGNFDYDEELEKVDVPTEYYEH